MDWGSFGDMPAITVILTVSLLILGLHPFVFYPLSLLVLRRAFSVERRRAAPCASAKVPARASICVCAYNEEAVIRQKAENLLRLKQAMPSLELLVYVDAANDDTAAILAKYAADIDVVVGGSRRGKTYGMRQLVDRARGDILVFSDANVMFDADAVAALLSRFSDASAGCVCGTLIYTNGDASATAAVSSLYWRLEEWIKQLEEDAGGVLCADGSIFAVRRSLYPHVPDDLIDDFYVSLSILCDGHRIVRAPDARAWEHSTTSAGDEFRRKVRIACQALNVHRRLWPRIARQSPLMVYKYLSHKLLRWLAGVHLAAAAGLGTLSSVLAFGWRPTVLTLLGGALVLGVGSAAKLSFAGKLVEVPLALTATALGLFKSLRGERFQTWTPATSVRACFRRDATRGEQPPLISPRPLYANHAKRVVDILGSAVLIILGAPIMAFIALMVGRDGAPVLFRHERIGADGQRFCCLKFRTMHVDAERMLRELLERDPEARREWREGFKLRDDPRVTPLGRFLRRTSLDELPQLFNVLRGEMSLVGPRPIVTQEVAFYDKHYALYKQCRPGITGLWQISGRSDLSYARRVELDCAYLTTWSVALDLVILLRTPARVLRQWGAY